MPDPQLYALNSLKKGAQAGGLARAITAEARAKYHLHSGRDSIEPLHDDDWEFCQAIDQFKLSTHTRFPSWSEALAVLKTLGYHR